MKGYQALAEWVSRKGHDNFIPSSGYTARAQRRRRNQRNNTKTSLIQQLKGLKA